MPDRNFNIGDYLAYVNGSPSLLGSIVRVVELVIEDDEEFARVVFIQPAITSNRRIGERGNFYTWRFTKVEHPMQGQWNNLSKIDIKIRQMDERFKSRNSHAK